MRFEQLLSFRANIERNCSAIRFYIDGNRKEIALQLLDTMLDFENVAQCMCHINFNQ